MTDSNPNPAVAGGRVRWLICGLLFLATTINYMDRQILGILAPTLERDIGWSESQYGFIVTAFNAAYAIGLLGFGRFIDVLGTRRGYALSVGLWSLAASLHGAVTSALGFGAARFALGLGEAGNFPAAVKTVSEWFPRRERAFAVGLFNCGSNVGAIVTPLMVPWIALHWGWRWAFILTGAVGFLWILGWVALYRRPTEHPRLSKSELDYILSDAEPPAPSRPWLALLQYRQVWALVLARFLTDPVWWFYLYWIPKFLHSKHGLTLDKIGLPLVVIYVAADGGSVFGGWLSSTLIKRGWTVSAARKTAILVSALMVTPMMFGAQASETWVAVLILSLATAGHQGWAANMFASISDMFPRNAVSSVTGITGFGGSAGGMLVATATGFILEATGSYVPIFLWAGIAYLVILGLIHVMIPRIEPVEVGRVRPWGEGS
ncbi:MAG: MFS transporter [Acidobacteria bacterium]|nr:MFS transporter [Acidobacteriota bacterium]